MGSIKPTAASSFSDYIAQLDEPRRSDVAALDKLIRKAAPELEPVLLEMPTTVMLGYGPFHYKYASGREGDSAVISLASQKNHIALYAFCSPPEGDAYLAERFAPRLGKVSVGKSCVRIKRLTDVDEDELSEMLGLAQKLGPPATAV
jgi:uncharacterized protein YdhG (YjbR/CyaY superfamily)